MVHDECLVEPQTPTFTSDNRFHSKVIVQSSKTCLPHTRRLNMKTQYEAVNLIWQSYAAHPHYALWDHCPIPFWCISQTNILILVFSCLYRHRMLENSTMMFSGSWNRSERLRIQLHPNFFIFLFLGSASIKQPGLTPQIRVMAHKSRLHLLHF